MKKRLFSSCLKAAAALLLAFAVASCAQSAGGDDEGTVSGGTVSNAASTRKVSISVGDKNASGPSMMILPSVGSDLFGDDGTIKYSPIILTGTSAKGTQVGGSADGIHLESEFDPATSTANVDLDATYWELTLTAYDKVSGKPALRGVRAVDLTHGVADVTFTLSPGKLDDGAGGFYNGTVHIAGTFTSSAADIVTNVNSYKIGLYERNKKELTTVAGYEDTKPVTGLTSPASIAFDWDKSDAYSCPPGEYLFVFQLLDVNGAVVTQYSDLIIVDSGLCTEATLNIEDEDSVDAPTDFMAYLVDDSQENGKYQVRFTWDPTPSWNATQFVLQITDVDSSETQTLPSERAGSGEGNFAAYADGSLMAGAEYCIVSLPANHRYEATIKARSARGRESAVVSREAATGTVSGCTGFGADSVNQLMRIYELAGGIYTDGDGNEHSPRYIDWNTYTGSDVDLLPVGNVSKVIGTGTSATSVACTKWKRNNADGSVTVFDPNDASYVPPAGFVDGTYTAVYLSTSIEAILDPHEPKVLDAGDVTLTGGNLNGTKLKIATNETVGIDVTDSAMDADHPTRFIGYKIMVGNTVLYCEANTTGSFSYTIPASTFAPGSYDLHVIGVGTDNYDYSYTVKLLVHAAGGHP
ncbi:MAG: hypothetical protein K6G18_07845 [Treponema sp.]|nr:hypothetical protein [Treponema sp.]